MKRCLAESLAKFIASIDSPSSKSREALLEQSALCLSLASALWFLAAEERAESEGSELLCEPPQAADTNCDLNDTTSPCNRTNNTAVTGLRTRLADAMVERDVVLDGQAAYPKRLLCITEAQAAEAANLVYPNYTSLRLFERSPIATFADAPDAEVFLLSEAEPLARALAGAKTDQADRELNTEKECNALFSLLSAASVRTHTLDVDGRDGQQAQVITLKTVADICGVPELMIRDAVDLGCLPRPNLRCSPFPNAGCHECWPVGNWLALVRRLFFFTGSLAERTLRAGSRPTLSKPPTFFIALQQLKNLATPHDVFSAGSSASSATKKMAIRKSAVEAMCQHSFRLPQPAHRVCSRGTPWVYTEDQFPAIAELIHEHIAVADVQLSTEANPDEEVGHLGIRLENALRERVVIGRGVCCCLTVGDIGDVVGRTKDEVLTTLGATGFHGGIGLDANTGEPAYTADLIDCIAEIFGS